MINATVIYHHEDDTWWAESPQAEGWSAAADSYAELRVLVREGLAFHFDSADVRIEERLDDGAPIGGILWGAGVSAFSGAIAKVTGGLGIAGIAPARSSLAIDSVTV